MSKKRVEPLWCKMYRDQVIKPKQKERQTEQVGRTVASQSGFYTSKAWIKVRNKRRLNNPLCQHCEKRGFYKPMALVDHIKSVDEAPELALVYDNTQSLCNFCHNIKTQADARAKKKTDKLRHGKKLMIDLETPADPRGVG